MQHSLKHLFASFSHLEPVLSQLDCGEILQVISAERRTVLKIHLKCTSLVPYQTLHQCEQEDVYKRQGPIFRIAENIFLSFIIFIVTNNQLLIIEGIR